MLKNLFALQKQLGSHSKVARARNHSEISVQLIAKVSEQLIDYHMVQCLEVHILIAWTRQCRNIESQTSIIDKV